MVKVSTLFYVLENLEGESEEVINLDEIYELEQKYLNSVLERMNGAFQLRPGVIENILQSANKL